MKETEGKLIGHTFDNNRACLFVCRIKYQGPKNESCSFKNNS